MQILRLEMRCNTGLNICDHHTYSTSRCNETVSIVAAHIFQVYSVCSLSCLFFECSLTKRDHYAWSYLLAIRTRAALCLHLSWTIPTSSWQRHVCAHLSIYVCSLDSVREPKKLSIWCLISSIYGYRMISSRQIYSALWFSARLVEVEVATKFNA